MSAQSNRPIRHRVLTGELKHHFLLKSGRLSWQKTPLTVHSNRQRIGFQLLVDETGGAFVDLYPIGEAGLPRMDLVPAFLTLAWSAPLAYAAKRPPTLGVPDILCIPQKSLTQKARADLQLMARTLDFELENPTSGFSAGAHLVKALCNGLDEVIRWNRHAQDLDLLAGDNMELASFFVAARMTLNIAAKAPLRALQAGGYLYKATYAHRVLPPEWFSHVASLYRRSDEDLRKVCRNYYEYASKSKTNHTN